MHTDTEKTTQPYHHGNVKESLIAEAMKLLEANALDKLSLRRLAREVGVTPSAIYNHFTDKNNLLLAIKIRLYEDINRFFDERCNGTNNPESDLLDMCLAYYHYSRLYPSRFQFLFGSTLPLEWSSPELVRVSCRSIVRARRLVLDIFRKYRVACDETTAVNTTLLIWSQLHGIITLKKSGSIQAAVVFQDWPASCALLRDEAVEELIADHIAMTVKGIVNARQPDQPVDSHH